MTGVASGRGLHINHVMANDRWCHLSKSTQNYDLSRTQLEITPEFCFCHGTSSRKVAGVLMQQCCSGKHFVTPEFSFPHYLRVGRSIKAQMISIPEGRPLQ